MEKKYICIYSRQVRSKLSYDGPNQEQSRWPSVGKNIKTIIVSSASYYTKMKEEIIAISTNLEESHTHSIEQTIHCKKKI